MGGDVHTLPVSDLVDHDERRNCWCQPKLLRACPECVEIEARECWNCYGEGVLLANIDDAIGIMVVHNAADGRA